MAVACLLSGRGASWLRNLGFALGASVVACSSPAFGQAGSSSTGNGGMGGMGGGPAAMAPSNVNGLAFYSASMLAGYSTYPVAGQNRSLPTDVANTLGRWTTGGMASMGYGKVLGERSRLGIVYTPGYLVRPQALDRSRMFHFLNINLAQGITSRLSLALGISASYSELDQFAFSPAQYSLVTSAPGSFDDLFNAISGGQFSNSQIASLLTGAPVLDVSARSSIYGNQAFTANAYGKLNYKITPRLSLLFAGGANRYQSVGIRGDSLDRQAIVPYTLNYNANTGLNFAITPRTSIGANATFTKIHSRYRNNGFLTATGNVTQRLGQKMAITVSAGSGKSIVGSSPLLSSGSNFGNRVLFNAQFTTQISTTQTFMVNYGRTFVDEFGIGSRNMQTSSGAWSYAPQGSHWSGTISVGYQRSDLPVTARNLQAYFVSTAFNRKLTNHLGMSFQGYYVRANNQLGQQYGISTQGEFENSGVRMLFTWFPTPLEY